MQIGAGGLSAGLLTAAAEPLPLYPPEKRLGIALVGLGKLTLGQLVPAFANARGVRLAALVSGDRAKAMKVAAEQRLAPDSVYTYAEFDRAVRDPRIDIVYVVLPNFLHAEYTIRALRARKHVLCEKPLATKVADAEAMIAAADKAKRKLMTAYRLHYEPLNLEAMRRIRSGTMGRPRLVITNMGRQADPADPSDAWRLDARKSGGGALADMGVYGVNGARYLLNEEPVEVRAWAHTDRRDPRFREVEDLISWQFRFPSGAIAQGSTSFNCSATMAFEVICERGRLKADPGAFYGGNRLTVHGMPGEGEPKIVEIDQFAREMDWMAEVVRGKAPLVTPGEEGLQDMRLMEAILRSVREGGATIRTDWGYRRAFDPAAVVAPPRERARA